MVTVRLREPLSAADLQLNVADALIAWADEVRKDGSMLALASAEELAATLPSLREKYPAFVYQWMRLELALADTPELVMEAGS